MPAILRINRRLGTSLWRHRARMMVRHFDWEWTRERLVEVTPLRVGLRLIFLRGMRGHRPSNHEVMNKELGQRLPKSFDSGAGEKVFLASASETKTSGIPGSCWLDYLNFRGSHFNNIEESN